MNITQKSGGSIPTFKLLDDIVTVLGSTKLAFWPGLSTHGSGVQAYGTGNDAPNLLSFNETTGEDLQDDFAGMIHSGSVVSYYLDSSKNNNLQAVDDADLSFTSSGMSVGLWILMTEALGTKKTLISKYDETGAAEVREYTFDIDTSGNLILEMYDESANASEIGTGASDVIVPFVWTFVVATYNGNPGAPAVHLYKNGVDSLSSGATTETGSFDNMEDLGGDVGIGCQVRAASTVQEFEGRIALPFITGRQLAVSDVATIYNIGRTLLGLA